MAMSLQVILIAKEMADYMSWIVVLQESAKMKTKAGDIVLVKRKEMM